MPDADSRVIAPDSPRGAARRRVRHFAATLCLLAGTLTSYGIDETTPVEALVTDLSASEIPKRRDASYYLARLGPKAKDALPALIKALEDQDKQVWSNSIAGIAAIGPDAKEAIPVLLDAMDSRKSRGRSRDRGQVIFRSAYALTKIGPAAIPPLIAALEVDDSTLRAGAAKALGGMGTAAREAIPALLANLGHGDTFVRREVIDALSLMGKDSKPKLVEALSWTEPRQRSAAVLALGGMGLDARDAAAVMTARLKMESDAEVRTALFTTLPKIGAEPAQLIPALMEALKSETEATRHAAANGLLALRGARAETIEALKTRLRDSDAAQSKRAAYVLGRLGSDATGAVPVILDVALKQTPPAGEYIAALSEIGPGAIPGILKSVEQAPLESLNAQHWAVPCLQLMGTSALTALREGLNQPNPQARLLSVRVVTAIGPDAERVAATLMEKLDDPEVQVRAAALGALVAVNAEMNVVLPRLEKALQDGSPAVRAAAVRLVPGLGESARHLNPSVIGKLKDPDASVRRAVMESLGPTQAEAVPSILPLLSDEATRSTALDAIGRMGANAHAAVPRLIELLQTPSKPTQLQVLGVLAKIGPAAKDARPAVDPLRQQSDTQLRAAGIVTAAAVEPETSARVALLATALGDADVSVRQMAADALVPMGEKASGAAPKLVAMVKQDGDREFALAVLKKIRLRDVPLLIELLGQPQFEVKLFACEELQRVGKKAKDAIPALELVTKESSEDLSRAARRALRAINSN